MKPEYSYLHKLFRDLLSANVISKTSFSIGASGDVRWRMVVLALVARCSSKQPRTYSGSHVDAERVTSGKWALRVHAVESGPQFSHAIRRSPSLASCSTPSRPLMLFSNHTRPSDMDNKYYYHMHRQFTPITTHATSHLPQFFQFF
jgi:hypothetical protein